MNETLTLKEQWEKVKRGLTYSHINCFICNEKLYYSSQVRLKVGQKAIFSCKCREKIAVEDRKNEGESSTSICASCGKTVTFEENFELATRFRCTCGHSDLVLNSKIESTNKI